MNFVKYTAITLLTVSVLLLWRSIGKNEVTSEGPVIQQLLDGNKRYRESRPIHPDQSKFRRESLADGQKPKAIVVSCSDSRVPPEIILDQGLGDLFTIRTAGNVIGDIELASIEYAVLKFQCNTVLVLGHEKCGAIQAFLEQPSGYHPGHLDELIQFIRQQPVQLRLLDSSGDKSYQSVINNVIYAVKQVRTHSTVIAEHFDGRELEIYGAVYHLKNGQVQIIDDEIKQ
jgi:carbonic anhydrase